MPPTVSILIPCYQAEPWVGDAVECALAQTHSSVEVLALDDGSTDGTLSVLRRYEDRIGVLSQSNGGSAAARNALTERATGEWVQYLDADDLIDPSKIARQFDLIAARPCDLVAAPVRQGEEIIKAPDDDDPWICLMESNLGITVSNLWRRETVLAAGGWAADVPSSQEYELMVRMLAAGARVEYDPAVHSEHRILHADSISTRNYDRSRYQHCRVVEQAVTTLRGLGQLTDARRRVAAVVVFDMAQRLWGSSRDLSHRLERIAVSVWPELRAELAERGRVYGKLYARLGFDAAQRYDQAAHVFRRRLLPQSS